MQDDFYTVQNCDELKNARNQGMISSAILMITGILPVVLGILGLKELEESLEIPIAIANLAALVLMYIALKNIQSICETDVFDLFKRNLLMIIPLLITGIIIGLSNSKDIAYIAIVILIAIFIYAFFLWVRTNLKLAKITDNKYFKIYAITICIVPFLMIGAFALLVMLDKSYNDPLTGILVVVGIFTLVMFIALILISALQLFAWKKIEIAYKHEVE